MPRIFKQRARTYGSGRKRDATRKVSFVYHASIGTTQNNMTILTAPEKGTLVEVIIDLNYLLKDFTGIGNMNGMLSIKRIQQQSNLPVYPPATADLDNQVDRDYMTSWNVSSYFIAADNIDQDVGSSAINIHRVIRKKRVLQTGDIVVLSHLAEAAANWILSGFVHLVYLE